MKIVAVIRESSAQVQNQIYALAESIRPLGGSAQLIYLRKCEDAGELPDFRGYEKVLTVRPKGTLPEAPEVWADAAERFVKPDEEVLVVLPATMEGSEAAALLAGRLGCGCLLNVKTLRQSEEGPVLSRPAYSNNLTVSFVPESLPAVCSVTVQPAAEVPEGEAPAVEEVQLAEAYEEPSWLEEAEIIPRAEEEGITAAKRVVVAGRGVGSREKIPQMRELAEALDARLAATRPVVYDGWVDKSCMVGASSAIIAPELCVVMGASGAAAFAAGVEKSKYLVAVNNDPSAAVFRIADLGIVEDCNALAEALLRELGGEKIE